LELPEPLTFDARSEFRCRKARSQKQRISSRASLNILVPGSDREPFARTKGFDLVSLRREFQTAAALLALADPQISL
jgi:hypothetical protein